MPGVVWINPSNVLFYAKDASISPPDSTYVLQSGSDGSLDRAPQQYKPYGSGGFPPIGDESTRGTFTGKIR